MEEALHTSVHMWAGAARDTRAAAGRRTRSRLAAAGKLAAVPPRTAGTLRAAGLEHLITHASQTQQA